MPNSFMQRAIALSIENATSGNGGPFGCVIVKDGAIIAEGANRVTATNDPTAHAEIVALRDACTKLGTFQLDGCDIYSSCEPCPMCLGAIYWARPTRVFFAATHTQATAAGFDDSFIYQQLEVPGKDRSIPMVQVDSADSNRPFEEWATHAGRVEY